MLLAEASCSSGLFCCDFVSALSPTVLRSDAKLIRIRSNESFKGFI